MTIAYDAVSSATEGTGTLTWTHTPAGTPAGVIVYVIQNTGTDLVTGVTYGGITMSEVTDSPNLKAAAEDGAVYGYFLGSSIPTGAQTVEVSVTGGAITKAAVAITVTAAGDTAVQDTDVTINSDAEADPSATLSLGGNSCFCAIGFMSGIGATANITPLTDWTSRYEFDFTNQTAGVYTYDTIGTSDVAIGWDQTSEDAVAVGIAITEDAGGGSAAPAGVGLKTIQYEVWLLDPFGNLLDVIDDWLSLNYNRALNNVGSLELGLDGGYPNFDFIKLDGRVVIWRDGRIDMETTWIIRRIIKTLDENGTLGISIGAFSANELLTRRIVAYDDGTSYADKTQVAADNMMKAVIRENFGSSASDTSRSIATYFSVEADTGQGPLLTKSFAWNNVLDVTQDISLTTISAGSAVYFDVVAPTYNTFEFRTYRAQRGLDHTFPNGQSPVVLSPDRGNLTSVLRSFDYSDEATYIYAGGAGFNQFRYVTTASNADRLGQSPLNRREMFLSSGGIAQAVDDDAQAALRENRPKRVFQGQLVNVPGTTEYGVHWNFGDLLTVEFDGETINCSVDAVQIEVANGEESITATLRALET